MKKNKLKEYEIVDAQVECTLLDVDKFKVEINKEESRILDKEEVNNMLFNKEKYFFVGKYKVETVVILQCLDEFIEYSINRENRKLH